MKREWVVRGKIRERHRSRFVWFDERKISYLLYLFIFFPFYCISFQLFPLFLMSPFTWLHYLVLASYPRFSSFKIQCMCVRYPCSVHQFMCPNHCIIFYSTGTSTNKFWILICALSIPVAMRSKAQVFSRLNAGISVSNLAGHGCSSVVFIVLCWS